ncbi:MAG: 3-dehydroquinate synthase [Omnitrophica bacterium RIFCSPLOWO2_01_FULL_45_10]|nr:MAG: 3-dehydroquinate synthase [Omnitrophica bacterium RIFCSPLOWO2_01_FULL_45_10]
MKKIRVHLKENSYELLVGRGLLKNCGPFIKSLNLGRDSVVITNRRIVNLYGNDLKQALKESGFSIHFELVPDSEKAKSSEVLIDILNRISLYDRRKALFIAAFGGGVVGDVAGFSACVYKRGVPYIQIPTTLLAQVDSSIGGKVAIDLAAAKNMVGTFYQPKLVLSDISLLNSLPKRQIRSGLAEVVKYGVIKDIRLFEYLESNFDSLLELEEDALQHVVARSGEIKAHFVEKDPFDKTGIRTVLNYGHTMGHAIETASGYSDKYSHGEAIAIGMVIASEISVRLKLLDDRDAERLENLIKDIGLPTDIKDLDFGKIYESHLRDKKFIHGRNRFILPVKIGSMPKVFEDVPEKIVRDVLRQRIRYG